MTKHRATSPRRSLAIALVAALGGTAHATPGDDFERGTNFFVAGFTVVIDGQFFGAEALELPKAPGSLNTTLSSSALGFPVDVTIPLHGSRIGNTMTWTFDASPNIPLAATCSLGRIWGTLVAHAGLIPGGVDPRCAGGAPCPFNVRLDEAPGNEAHIRVDGFGCPGQRDATEIHMTAFGGVPRAHLNGLEIDRAADGNVCARDWERVVGARVFIDEPAPTGGAWVDVTSSDPVHVRVGGVRVGDGQRWSRFPIVIAPGFSGSVLITAAAGGRSVTEALAVDSQEACEARAALGPYYIHTIWGCLPCLELVAVPGGGVAAGAIEGLPYLLSDRDDAIALAPLFPEGKQSVRDANRDGVVIGVWTHQDGKVQGFFGSPLEGLAALGEGYLPSKISERGAIAGTRVDGQLGTVAFIANRQGARDLPLSPRAITGINDLGQVAGDLTAGKGVHAFRYQSGKTVDLGDLGGGESHALALGGAGDVVGYSKTKSGAVHAFVSIGNGKPMTDLGQLAPWTDFRATSVNSAGVIVGTASGAKGQQSHAFLYTAGSGIVDLNQLLPRGTDATILSALSINDDFEIAVHGIVRGVEGDFSLRLQGK